MNWKKNPTHKNAPAAFTREIQAEITQGQKLKTPASQAKAEYDTFRRTAQIGEMVDRALAGQAVAVEESGLYAYHPQRFASTSDLIHHALQGVRRGSSEWSDLSFLAEVLVPYLAQHDIPGRESLYRYGVIAKSRQAANFLRPILRHPTAAAKPIVESVMADLANTDLSLAQFSKRYTHKPRSVACSACHIGTFMVISLKDEADAKKITGALAGKVVWELEPKLALVELAKSLD